MPNILEEANEIIFGERNKTYGHPRDQFALVARLWSDYLGVEVTPDDHAVMMILLKASRVKTGGYHRDAAVDIAGYAGTMERLREPVAPLADWERELTWVVDGRRYYTTWADVPHGKAVNSSDEDDSVEPWHGNGTDNAYGTPPYREWIDPASVPRPARKWDRVRNIPVGVEATDRDGDFYLRVQNGFKFLLAADEGYIEDQDKLDLSIADNHDMFAPFTEAEDKL